MSIPITADLGPALAEEGTLAYRRELERVATAVREQAPGTAAALVDWAGTEISRLRAWATARSVLMARIADAQAAAQAAAFDRGAFRLSA